MGLPAPRPLLAFLAGVLAFAGAGAARAEPAQVPPTTTVDPLTVTGSRPPDPAPPSAVAGAVRAYAKPSRIGQMSRWAGPICVRTIGLPDAFNAFVTARVGEVAARAGAPPVSACEGPANVLVVFTTEPQTLMDDVRAHHPELLGFHYRAQAARLAHFDGPIEAWHATASATENGMPYLDDPFSQVPGGSSASRLSTGLKSQFAAVLVVADAATVADQPVGKVADFVAMLVLTRPVMPLPCDGLASILDAFNPACGGPKAEAITANDEAFLRGLYSSFGDRTIAQQRSELTGRIKREARNGRTGKR